MASLKAPKRWKSEGAVSVLKGGWGKTVHPSFAIAFCVIRLVCVCVCVVVRCRDRGGF